MQHLIEQSGLAARTIRHYVERGLIPRPRGLGPAAEYDEEHLARAVAIARMRARGMSVDAIAEHVRGWTTARFKRYVRDTDPAPEPPPAPAPAPAPPPASAPARALAPDDAVDGEPVLPPGAPPRARLRGGEDDASRVDGAIDAVSDDARLPDAPAWRIYSLITGLGLMVDVDAPPVVHVVAREILARYGRRRA